MPVMSGTGTRSAPKASSRLRPGHARCTACTIYHHSLPGSSSPRSRETQMNRRSSDALARHCAARMVLPKPAGASMRTSLAAVPARRLMSARRSTHSLRRLGAWSLVSSRVELGEGPHTT